MLHCICCSSTTRNLGLGIINVPFLQLVAHKLGIGPVLALLVDPLGKAGQDG